MGSTVLTADDVNLLVYRYLQESGERTCIASMLYALSIKSILINSCEPVLFLNSAVFSHAGFRHAAFTLAYEAQVKKNGEDMPPGALVSFVQKGLQYMELEANLNEARLPLPHRGLPASMWGLADVSARPQDGTEVEADFSKLTAHDLLSKSTEELKVLARERRDGAGRDRDRDGGKAGSRGAKAEVGEGRVKAEPRRGDDDKGDAGSCVLACLPLRMIVACYDALVAQFAEPMDEDGAGEATVSASDVTILEGHTSEVFICAWSPTASLLASGCDQLPLFLEGCGYKRHSAR